MTVLVVLSIILMLLSNILTTETYPHRKASSNSVDT